MKNKNNTPLVYDITTNTFSSPYQAAETFDTPKIKPFNVEVTMSSNKPNKITYDSRDQKNKNNK